MATLFGLAGLSARLLRHTLGMRFQPLSLGERLAMLPERAPVAAPHKLSFNDSHIPLVEAQTLSDGAVGLGIVHGHLRLAQIEVMRHAAQGRISEVAGKAAVGLDMLLRLIDFPRAGDASLDMMPQQTRAWVEGFAQGLSVASAMHPAPPEFAALGIRPAPFSAQDIFAISRLCSADYSWRVWRTLNRLRQEDDWAQMWADLIGVPSTGAQDLGAQTATAFTRMGSNAFALSGTRTASGKPMLSCDPHLVIAAPNPWIILGLKLPDLMVWGLTIPGLPIFGAGRNDFGAWGGTNLHATSSALVDVSGEELREEQVSINPRRSRPIKVTLRQSSMGPVLSDTKPFAMPAETVALKWVGHRPSDEFTPYLNMMRAKSWGDFHDAVDGAALPGLTMIWAGVDGTIGKMIAGHFPQRPLKAPDDIVIARGTAKAQWETLLTGRDLPMEKDPADGLVVSANDAPHDPPITISHFFSDPIRSDRIRQIFDGKAGITAADVCATHGDQYLAPAAALAARWAQLGVAVRPSSPVAAALRSWDGAFDSTSKGALAFVLTATTLIKKLAASVPRPVANPPWRLLARLITVSDRADDRVLGEAIAAALDAAERPFARHRTWGGAHRLRLSHPLRRLPWLRRRLPVIDLPTGGSSETLCKSLHPFTHARHATNFGANARFFADLAHPDETYAVLLGGQDGWPGSHTMFDMIIPWRRGTMIRLPSTDAARSEAFHHTRTVLPGDD
ncbi:MAG: penicillin acylase family protein [Pseudomonadota bacterium]